MTGMAKTTVGGLLRMLCALAMLSLSFAHKPPQVMAAVLQSAELQLPDGSYADICISNSAIKHPVAALYCEVCMLSGSALIPGPDNQSWLISHFSSVAAARMSERQAVISLPIDRARSRAPPAFS